MAPDALPEEVVQRQMDAYNARDLDGWLSTYAQDAQQFEYPSTLLADGIDAIRKRAVLRFQEPNLRAHLLRRTIVGDVVIDHENVVRTFPEGTGRMEMVAIYQVVSGAIKTATFVFGPMQLD